MQTLVCAVLNGLSIKVLITHMNPRELNRFIISMNGVRAGHFVKWDIFFVQTQQETGASAVVQITVRTKFSNDFLSQICDWLDTIRKDSAQELSTQSSNPEYPWHFLRQGLVYSSPNCPKCCSNLAEKEQDICRSVSAFLFQNKPFNYDCFVGRQVRCVVRTFAYPRVFSYFCKTFHFGERTSTWITSIERAGFCFQEQKKILDLRRCCGKLLSCNGFRLIPKSSPHSVSRINIIQWSWYW